MSRPVSVDGRVAFEVLKFNRYGVKQRRIVTVCDSTSSTTDAKHIDQIAIRILNLKGRVKREITERQLDGLEPIEDVKQTTDRNRALCIRYRLSASESLQKRVCVFATPTARSLFVERVLHRCPTTDVGVLRRRSLAEALAVHANEATDKSSADKSEQQKDIPALENQLFSIQTWTVQIENIYGFRQTFDTELRPGDGRLTFIDESVSGEETFTVLLELIANIDCHTIDQSTLCIRCNEPPFGQRGPRNVVVTFSDATERQQFVDIISMAYTRRCTILQQNSGIKSKLKKILPVSYTWLDTLPTVDWLRFNTRKVNQNKLLPRILLLSEKRRVLLVINTSEIKGFSVGAAVPSKSRVEQMMTIHSGRYILERSALSEKRLSLYTIDRCDTGRTMQTSNVRNGTCFEFESQAERERFCAYTQRLISSEAVVNTAALTDSTCEMGINSVKPNSSETNQTIKKPNNGTLHDISSAWAKEYPRSAVGLYVATYNIGGSPPPIDTRQLSLWLPRPHLGDDAAFAQHAANVHSMNNGASPKSMRVQKNERIDCYVIGLQEIGPQKHREAWLNAFLAHLNASPADTDIGRFRRSATVSLARPSIRQQSKSPITTAQEHAKAGLLVGGASHDVKSRTTENIKEDEVYDSAYVNANHNQSRTQFNTKTPNVPVEAGINDTSNQFILVVSHFMWELGLYVFIRQSACSEISNVCVADEATGLSLAKNVTGRQLGNKGGVGISLCWRGTPLAFIVCHLAARPERIVERERDFCQIMSRLKLDTLYPTPATGSDESRIADILSQHEHLWLLGDLNYRLDIEYEKALDLFEHGQWDELRQYDQLLHERTERRVLDGFQEGLIEFAPTYRWQRSITKFSNKRGQAPSYTDRIFARSLPGIEHVLSQRFYGAATRFFGSDHRPVFATYSLQLRLPIVAPTRPLRHTVLPSPTCFAHVDNVSITTPALVLSHVSVANFPAIRAPKNMFLSFHAGWLDETSPPLVSAAVTASGLSESTFEVLSQLSIALRQEEREAAKLTKRNRSKKSAAVDCGLNSNNDNTFEGEASTSGTKIHSGLERRRSVVLRHSTRISQHSQGSSVPSSPLPVGTDRYDRRSTVSGPVRRIATAPLHSMTINNTGWRESGSSPTFGIPEESVHSSSMSSRSSVTSASVIDDDDIHDDGSSINFERHEYSTSEAVSSTTQTAALDSITGICTGVSSNDTLDNSAFSREELLRLQCNYEFGQTVPMLPAAMWDPRILRDSHLIISAHHTTDTRSKPKFVGCATVPLVQICNAAAAAHYKHVTTQANESWRQTLNEATHSENSTPTSSSHRRKSLAKVAKYASSFDSNGIPWTMKADPVPFAVELYQDAQPVALVQGMAAFRPIQASASQSFELNASQRNQTNNKSMPTFKSSMKALTTTLDRIDEVSNGPESPLKPSDMDFEESDSSAKVQSPSSPKLTFSMRKNTAISSISELAPKNVSLNQQHRPVLSTGLSQVVSNATKSKSNQILIYLPNSSITGGPPAPPPRPDAAPEEVDSHSSDRPIADYPLQLTQTKQINTFLQENNENMTKMSMDTQSIDTTGVKLDSAHPNASEHTNSISMSAIDKSPVSTLPLSSSKQSQTNRVVVLPPPPSVPQPTTTKLTLLPPPSVPPPITARQTLLHPPSTHVTTTTQTQVAVSLSTNRAKGKQSTTGPNQSYQPNERTGTPSSTTTGILSPHVSSSKWSNTTTTSVLHPQPNTTRKSSSEESIPVVPSPPRKPAETMLAPPPRVPAETTLAAPPRVPANAVLAPPPRKPAETMLAPPPRVPTETTLAPPPRVPANAVLAPPPRKPTETMLAPPPRVPTEEMLPPPPRVPKETKAQSSGNVPTAPHTVRTIPHTIRSDAIVPPPPSTAAMKSQQSTKKQDTSLLPNISSTSVDVTNNDSRRLNSTDDHTKSHIQQFPIPPPPPQNTVPKQSMKSVDTTQQAVSIHSNTISDTSTSHEGNKQDLVTAVKASAAHQQLFNAPSVTKEGDKSTTPNYSSTPHSNPEASSSVIGTTPNASTGTVPIPSNRGLNSDTTTVVNNSKPYTEINNPQIESKSSVNETHTHSTTVAQAMDKEDELLPSGRRRRLKGKVIVKPSSGDTVK